MKKHDQVMSKCVRPDIGYVTRTGNGWADVEWHVGIGCTYRRRVKQSDVVLFSDVLKWARGYVDNRHDSNK